MIRTELLQAFAAIAEAGSVTGAATRLGMSKSVVSERLTMLERELGTRLLQRSTRVTRLTSDGEGFYTRARRILDDLEDAQSSLAAGDRVVRGRLRVAAPMTFGRIYVAPMIRSFLCAHPGVELTLDLDDRRVDVVGEGYDLAIRIGRLSDSALVARKLADSRTVLVASPAYLARSGRPLRVDDLEQHEAILYSNRPILGEWQFDQRGRTRVVRTRGRFLVNNGEVVRDAAIDGLGLAFLPMFIACDAIASGQLELIELDAAPAVDGIYALLPDRRVLPARTRMLVEHLAQALAGPPPWERPR